jgi:hypothetical protein
MEAIFKMNYSAGRMGSLKGIFVVDKERMRELIDGGEDVYFGEVLGKHSEIYGPVEEGDITLVSEDPVVVEWFKSLNMETGYNPFNYIGK